MVNSIRMRILEASPEPSFACAPPPDFVLHRATHPDANQPQRPHQNQQPQENSLQQRPMPDRFTVAMEMPLPIKKKVAVNSIFATFAPRIA